jgi:hypothetical protein
MVMFEKLINAAPMAAFIDGLYVSETVVAELWSSVTGLYLAYRCIGHGYRIYIVWT